MAFINHLKLLYLKKWDKTMMESSKFSMHLSASYYVVLNLVLHLRNTNTYGSCTFTCDLLVFMQVPLELKSSSTLGPKDGIFVKIQKRDMGQGQVNSSLDD